MDRALRDNLSNVKEADFGLSLAATEFNLDFELNHNSFQETYCLCHPEDMPERAYEDYINLEDLYSQIKNPTGENQMRIKYVRELMQDYAEINS